VASNALVFDNFAQHSISLADRKVSALSQRLAEKRQKLQPTPPPADPRIFGDTPGVLPQPAPVKGYGDELFFGNQNTSALGNAIDLVQADLYRGAFSLGDLITGNKVDPALTRQLADRAAGLDPEYREDLSRRQGEVVTAAAEDRYWDAFKGALAVGPETILDSSSSLAELGLGSYLMSLPGGQALGGPLLARRVAETADTIADIKEAYDEAKETSRLKKAADAIKTGVKDVGRASIMTADLVNQAQQEYYAKTGQEMSTARTAGTVLLTALTASFQPSIVRSVYLPKLPKLGKGKLSAEGEKAVAGKGAFSREMQRLIEYADTPTLKKLAQRIVGGIGKVGAAGGAEAVQEYAQTWAEILSVRMDPEEAGGLLKAAYEQFTDPENRNEALGAAFLGAGAGATIRGATAVPAAAGGAALDVTADTAQAIGRRSAQAAKKAAVGSLSAAERLAASENTAQAKKAFEEVREENSRKGDILQEATSFDAIVDEDVQADILDNLKGDIDNKQDFDSAKAKTLGIYKGQVKALQGKYLGIAATTSLGKIGTAAEETARAAAIGVGEFFNITEEDIDKAVEGMKKAVKELPDTFVEGIKNIRSSSARGLAHIAMEYTTTGSKSALKKLRQMANEAEPDAIKLVADQFAGVAPKTAREFYKIADRKKAALKEAGLATDTVLDTKDLSQGTRHAAKGVIRTKNTPTVTGNQILEDAKAKLESLEAVDTVEKALNTYEEKFKGTDKALPENQVARAREKLKNERAAFEKTKTEKAKKVVQGWQESADKAAVDVIKRARIGGKKLAKWADKAISSLLKDDGPKVEYRFKDGEKVYVAQQSEKGQSVLGQVKALSLASVDEKENAETQERARAAVQAFLESDAAYENLAASFNITDPDALIALLKEAAPNIANKPEYRARAEKALSKQPDVAPEKAQKKATAKNEETKQTFVDEKGEIIDEEGAFIYAQELSQDQETLGKLLDSVFLDQDPCK
jgi:hypothetical protein